MPRIYYPVRPFHINQHFGENNPCVKNFGSPSQTIVPGSDDFTCPPGYDKLYKHFGISGHNGTDLEAGQQVVYAALAGTVIEKETTQSRGFGLGIISDQPYNLGAAGNNYLKLRYWHLKSFKVEVGAHVEVGTPIAISDNTGYSAGNHLHFEGQPMYRDAAGHYQLTYPAGNIGGAIDIESFFCGQYADIIPQIIPLWRQLIPKAQALIALLSGRN